MILSSEQSIEPNTRLRGLLSPTKTRRYFIGIRREPLLCDKYPEHVEGPVSQPDISTQRTAILYTGPFGDRLLLSRKQMFQIRKNYHGVWNLHRYFIPTLPLPEIQLLRYTKPTAFSSLPLTTYGADTTFHQSHSKIVRCGGANSLPYWGSSFVTRFRKS